MENLVVEKDYTSTQLKKFNITDSAIAEMKDRLGNLSIANIEDKKGYQAVRIGRLEVKEKRISVDKMRKELNSDALDYQRKVNAEAKRITALLEEIEIPLSEKEKAYEAEQARIEQALEAALMDRYKKRYDTLIENGMMFNGIALTIHLEQESGTIHASEFPERVKNADDKEFEIMLLKAKEINAKKLELEAIKKEEARKEDERLEQIRIEKEREEKAERERLEKIRLEELEKIKAENAALAQLRAEEELKRQNLEQLRREQLAEIKAENDRIEKLKQEELERIDVERTALEEEKAKLKAEREELLRQLKEKQQNNQELLMKNDHDKFGCVVCEEIAGGFPFCLVCANAIILKIQSVNPSLIDVAVAQLNKMISDNQKGA